MKQQQQKENLQPLGLWEVWKPGLVTAAVFWLLASSVKYGCALTGMSEETGTFLAKVAHSEEKLTWNNAEGAIVDK